MREVLAVVREAFCIGLWISIPVVLVGSSVLGLFWLFGTIIKSFVP